MRQVLPRKTVRPVSIAALVAAALLAVSAGATFAARPTVTIIDFSQDRS